MTRLLIASTGGHLAELALLAPRFTPPDADEIWITFDSAQSRSLLAGHNIRYIRDTPPRDWRAMLTNIASAWGALDAGVDTAISNGAGIAVSFLPLAVVKGISAHYIESAARVDGLSVSGRILEQARAIKAYTQFPERENQRWQYRGSSLDGFRSEKVSAPRPMRSVFVTVGTLDFSFMGLLRRLREILPATVQVTVQAGCDHERLDWPEANVRAKMAYQEIQTNIANSDVVVAHAGIGSALGVLQAGKVPVLVPRAASLGEHVDDHQTQIAAHLAERQLAVRAGSATIDLDDLSRALALRVVRTSAPPEFVLQ